MRSPNVVLLRDLEGCLPLATEENNAPPEVRDYIARLSQIVGEVLPPKDSQGPRTLVTRGLGGTALGDLLRDSYGVDIDGLTRGRQWVVQGGDGGRSSPTLYLNYLLVDEPFSQTAWQLVAFARRGFANEGFINMHCVSPHPREPEPPLQGSGDIARMPGVQEALTADINTLIEHAT